MKVKDYVELLRPYSETFDYNIFHDPYGEVVYDVIEERKLDVSTMRYYTTHYLINGVRYAPNDEI